MTFDELFALQPAATGWIAPATPRTDEPRLFGGVLIGQAIIAASAGTRRCHALHGFFISVGSMEQAFEIAVERTRDGGSFATRRVEIRQADSLLWTGLSSHHDGDAGPEHAMVMPDLPPPERLDDQTTIRDREAAAAGRPARRFLPELMLEARPVELPPTPPGGAQPARALWVRPRRPLGDTPALHQAVIGFASDMGLVHAGLLAHRRANAGKLQAASLDHSMWFHREAAAEDWMLHVHRTPSAGHGRGYSQGSVFTRDGVLVASVAQEFLSRKPKPAA